MTLSSLPACFPPAATATAPCSGKLGIRSKRFGNLAGSKRVSYDILGRIEGVPRSSGGAPP